MRVLDYSTMQEINREMYKLNNALKDFPNAKAEYQIQACPNEFNHFEFRLQISQYGNPEPQIEPQDFTMYLTQGAIRHLKSLVSLYEQKAYLAKTSQ